ncbi:DsrE family protein [Dielma fastidiosa]|uniref:DsrE family protein n=1 Tax=Dielma fastidiosa TaxID=1034346 RepID=UPI003562A5A2
MKVIYHVDEMAKWPLTLTNVSNMLAVYKQQGEAYKIEVLANSAAVKQYAQADELEEKMAALAKEGILFTACGNALKANQLKAEELYPFVEVVSAGVVELAKRQAEGYAYIKP